MALFFGENLNMNWVRDKFRDGIFISRSPLVVSGFLLLLAFNYHSVDLGETYVSRNLLAWAAMGASVLGLWWGPMGKGQLRWSPIWLGALFVPVAGAFGVLAIHILGSFESVQAGHLYLPAMLLVFAVFILGLLQRTFSNAEWAAFVLVVLTGFLPQYLLHFISTNPVLFFDISFTLPSFLVKPWAGFGQYNLFGSFLTSLIVMSAWAVACVPMARWQRIAIIGFGFLYAAEYPVMTSKTGVLGMLLGLVFLALHLWQANVDRSARRRFLIYLASLLLAYIGVSLALSLQPEKPVPLPDWSGDSVSIRTRWTMWFIAWRSFLEAPLFGHGLGSFSATYLEHFSRYGLAENLLFYRVVSVPHNLVMHVLSEAGLLGLLSLLAPLGALAFWLIRHSPNRWLIIGLCAPIGLHSQLEYPYIGSGGHYFLLAILLAAGLGRPDRPDRLKRLQKPALAKVIYGALAGACVALVFHIASLLMLVSSASQRFDAATRLPLDRYVEERYQSPDLSHPLIGKRMRAMTDLVLVSSALDEKRVDILRGLAIGLLEKNVLPFYASPPVWDLAFRAYAAAGNLAAMEALIAKVEKWQPDQADKYRHALQGER